EAPDSRRLESVFIERRSRPWGSSSARADRLGASGSPARASSARRPDNSAASAPLSFPAAPFRPGESDMLNPRPTPVRLDRPTDLNPQTDSSRNILVKGMNKESP